MCTCVVIPFMLYLLTCINPFLVCPNETDSFWGISWPPTNANDKAVQKCPGGVESLGRIELSYVNLYIRNILDRTC